MIVRLVIVRQLALAAGVLLPACYRVEYPGEYACRPDEQSCPDGYRCSGRTCVLATDARAPDATRLDARKDALSSDKTGDLRSVDQQPHPTDTSGGCGPITPQGCCAGQVLKYCDEGKLITFDCAFWKVEDCGWKVAKQEYDCLTTGGSDPTGAHPKPCP